VFTKYRVIESNGKFYPQRKRFLRGWKYQWCKYNYLAQFNTLDEAVAFVCKLKAPRNSDNVVWED